MILFLLLLLSKSYLHWSQMLADDLSIPAAYLNFEFNCSSHQRFEFNNSPHFKVSIVHRATIICWELQHLYDKLTMIDIVFSSVFFPIASSIKVINTVEYRETNLLSLALLFHYLMFNMFWMLIHPSSGACDLFVELFHGLYCSGSMCVGVTL